MQQRVKLAIFIFLLGLFLVSCGEQQAEAKDAKIDSALASFQQVQTNMQTIKDASYIINAEYDTFSGDIMMDQNRARVTGKEVNNPNGSAFSHFHVDDITTPVLKYDAYSKGSALYINDHGYKVKLDPNQPDPSYREAYNNPNNLLNISKDMIEDLNIITEDGNTSFIFLLKSDNEVVDYVSQSIGAVRTNRIFEKGKVKSTSVKVTIITDDNWLVKEMNINSVITATYQGDSRNVRKFVNKLMIKYNSLNTGLVINFPDFNDYLQY